MDQSQSNIAMQSRKILATESDHGESEGEIAVVDGFLSRFLLSSDSNTKGEINLFHALRAIPKRLNEVNFNRIEMMNLSLVQMSIIAFQNDDKDELFNFYDKRSKTRLHKLKLSSVDNSTHISDILKRLTLVFEKSMSMYGVNGQAVHRQGSSDTYADNDKSESASDFT